MAEAFAFRRSWCTARASQCQALHGTCRAPVEALRLEGIADDQSPRLEVLKAEYDAVYEMLSEKLATGVGPDAEIGEQSAEEMLEVAERWRTCEGLSLQRSECTERARSAARRILGDELASRVHGLVPRKAGW